MTWDLFLPTEPRSFVDLADVREGDPLPFHRALPSYAVTPLYELPSAAERLGVRRVLVKDESKRLGLPAFKMLGASWATARAIAREWFPELADVSLEAITTRLRETPGRGLAAATDGNHGRGVARMAKIVGMACTIFVPGGTADSRIADIESEGAEVIVVDGTYDDAIARSALEASDTVLVISDTSWEGYRDTPTDVIVGYSTMFREVDEQVDTAGIEPPDVVVFQSGVGSFAASGLRHYAAPSRVARPLTVIVEPTSANCLMRSARAGQLTEAPGPHPSSMAGLNCGLPSLLAWPVVESSTDAYLSIDDQWAFEAMVMFAEAGIVAGESGAASLGALLSVLEDDDARHALRLEPDSTVLLFNTEFATDPANFAIQVGSLVEEIVGAAPASRASAGTVAL